MKKIISLLMVLTITLLCCACSVDSGKSTIDEANSSEQLTYYYSEQYADNMVEVIQRYNRWCNTHSTEDMKINLIEFEDYNTMSERLNIEVMSGGGPDLFSNYMNLPYEKLMQNGAFLDLNGLIENDTAADRINLEDYNQIIMDAGVDDGKRYFIPTFYRVYTLVGEKNVFAKFQMPTQQGYHLTFDNMEEVFSDYLQNPDGYYFMSDELWGSGINSDTVILKLINSQVDFENKSFLFDEDFKAKLELLMKLKEHSTSSLFEDTDDTDSYMIKPLLFSSYDTHSNPIPMERMRTILDDGSIAADDTSILYSCFEKDENTYSAGIEYALFVNANTKKDDKVLAFLKYLLGKHLQNLFAGTEEEYWAGWGADCLPVLNTAFENVIRDAYNAIDDEGSIVGKKEELSPSTQALLTNIEKINSVSLYSNLHYSYYDRNVVFPILQDFYDGKIDIDKCADNLTTATKIYIEE